MSYDLHDKIPGSSYFTWQEALWLPSIRVYHIPSDDEQQAIIELAGRMEPVRSDLGVPLHVDCWIRPNSVNDGGGQWMGFDYNAKIGGAHDSAHIYGMALDVIPLGMKVDDMLLQTEPKCGQYQLAMENNGSHNGRMWGHFQSRPLSDGSYRVFNP